MGNSELNLPIAAKDLLAEVFVAWVLRMMEVLFCEGSVVTLIELV